MSESINFYLIPMPIQFSFEYLFVFMFCILMSVIAQLYLIPLISGRHGRPATKLPVRKTIKYFFIKTQCSSIRISNILCCNICHKDIADDFLYLSVLPAPYDVPGVLRPPQPGHDVPGWFPPAQADGDDQPGEVAANRPRLPAELPGGQSGGLEVRDRDMT